MESSDDPISPAGATGIEFFHIYTVNIEAGFTPQQSLYLLAVQMTGNPGEAPGSVVEPLHAHLCPHGAVICAPCDWVPSSWKP